MYAPKPSCTCIRNAPANFTCSLCNRSNYPPSPTLSLTSQALFSLHSSACCGSDVTNCCHSFTFDVWDLLMVSNYHPVNLHSGLRGRHTSLSYTFGRTPVHVYDLINVIPPIHYSIRVEGRARVSSLTLLRIFFSNNKTRVILFKRVRGVSQK